MKDDIMTAAEFFGEVEKCEPKPSMARKSQRSKSGKDLLAKVKARMVMRIYGVSRAKALEIIASREGEEHSLDMDRIVQANANRDCPIYDDEIISASS